MKLIIDIPEERYNRLDYIDSLSMKEIIRNGIPLGNITNGDVITITALFPKSKAYMSSDYINLYLRGYGLPNAIDKDWWNDKYVNEGESE